MGKKLFKSFEDPTIHTVSRQLYEELGDLLCQVPVTPSPTPAPMVNHIPGVILDVPYFSQHGLGAKKLRKDCGPACVKMCGDFYAAKPGITIDFIMGQATGGIDRGTYINELIAVSKSLYGVTLERYDAMTWEELKLFMDSGHPVLCLINYNYNAIRMDRNFRGGHYIVVVGYDHILCNGEIVLRFWIHDPDFYGTDTIAQGAYMPIVLPHFLKMWGNCHQNYSGNPNNMGLAALGVIEDD